MEYIKKKLYHWIEKQFMDGCSHYNSLAVRRRSRSKKQARDAFKRHKIPHASGRVFYWPWTAINFVKKHGFPVVVKPNIGGYSRGSFFPINNYQELWKAILLVKIWWPSSIIESYLLGKNYRVVAMQDSVEVAMQRYPAFVDGDGTNTIAKLIDKENEIRKEMKLLPIIHLIEQGKQTQKFLKKQGLTLESIPQKGQRIELFHRIALAPGGVLENIPLENITLKNKELFTKIVKIFDANLFGIDVIMEKGIDVDYDKQKCIFLELNSRPYLKMHDYPRFGEKPNLKTFYEKLEALDIEDKDTF